MPAPITWAIVDGTPADLAAHLSGERGNIVLRKANAKERRAVKAKLGDKVAAWSVTSGIAECAFNRVIVLHQRGFMSAISPAVFDAFNNHASATLANKFSTLGLLSPDAFKALEQEMEAFDTRLGTACAFAPITQHAPA